MPYVYRLVDNTGWEWPDLTSNAEDLASDKIYMEERYPDKGWRIQRQLRGSWEETQGVCRNCEEAIVMGFVDYSDTPGWVHADNDEALCDTMDEDSTDAEPVTIREDPLHVR